MAIERHQLITNFLLQTNTCGNSHHHHHNSDCNCCDTNFYYWCRNTTFIRFTANNAFCYKIFVIQIFIYVVSCSQKYSFPDNYRTCFGTNFLWKHDENGRGEMEDGRGNQEPRANCQQPTTNNQQPTT